MANLYNSTGEIIDIGNPVNSFESSYYIHMSFDDVTNCIKNLYTKGYESLFDEPFFNWLRVLHNTYGARFSLYIYNISDLANVTEKYKDDFLNARGWIKFGLHSATSSSTYQNSSYDDGQNDWNMVVNQVIRFTGSSEFVDRIPRLNYFYGSEDALKGMRDCECGALGFLAADDSRGSYYLDENQNLYIRSRDHIIDFKNGLIFYQTDFRGDWLKSGFTSEYDYDKPTESSVYEELKLRLQNPKYADSFKSIIWFCHEWQLYTGTTLNSNKVWVEDACRFAYDNKIPFDYPQNRIGMNPTSFQFIALN